MAVPNPRTINDKIISQVLRVYVPGGLPTGRDIQELLALIECSLVWSGIALIVEAWQKAREVPYDDPKRKEAEKEAAKWNNILKPLEGSYWQFLTRKYRGIVNEAQAMVGRPPFFDPYILQILLEKRIRSEKEKEPWWREMEILMRDLGERIEPERFVQHFVRRRHFGGVYRGSGEDFHIGDFNEWIGSELGKNLLTTQRIRLDKSLEYVFDIVAITSIVSCQNYPAMKELVTYSMGVLKCWMGKRKLPTPTPSMSPPRLTPSMTRLIAQYDDIDLEWEGKQARLKLKLRR